MSSSFIYDKIMKKESDNMNQQILDAKKKYLELLNNEENRSNTLSNIRFILFIILIIVGLLLWKTTNKIYIISLIILLVVFIGIVIYHHTIDNKIKKYNQFLDIIKQYESRVDGTWINFENKGDNLMSSNDLIKDFNITGDNSLFQLLNVARSIGGKKKYLKQLTEPSSNIQDYQEAVTELKNDFQTSLEIQYQLDQIEDIQETNFEDYFEYINQDIKPNKKEFVIGVILCLIADIIFVLCIFNALPFQIFGLALIIQVIISYIYLYFHNEPLENLNICSRKLSTLKNVDKWISNHNFNGSKFKKIHNDIANGYEAIQKLSRINELNNLRSNFVTNVIFNTIVSLNIVTMYKYAKLITSSNKVIKNNILALEELENILSLTTICYIKSDTCLPIVSEKLELDFKQIKHPLLSEKECIANDFISTGNINIITGSNMSGKSSFLRTIGINLILMESGTYVEAEYFKASRMTIFSSIKVEDDMNNKISTFYGELLRIKKILEYSSKKDEPIMIFIDEIFKGTNYNDRIYGAKEIIKKLKKLNAITFITTHDFELCDLEDKSIHNYHFEEKYEGTKITFDYIIKEGKCLTTNAKYLMKTLGIIE